MKYQMYNQLQHILEKKKKIDKTFYLKKVNY